MPKPRFALGQFSLGGFVPYEESDDLSEVCKAIPEHLDASDERLSIVERYGKRLVTLYEVWHYADPSEEG